MVFVLRVLFCWLTGRRLLGGGLMFGMGLLYMVFGDAIGGHQDWLSKSVLGLQVCIPCIMGAERMLTGDRSD